ncbi:MAG: hypothetical protein ACP5N1_04430 [Candidatus Woesearchaeota archaeon]
MTLMQNNNNLNDKIVKVTFEELSALDYISLSFYGRKCHKTLQILKNNEIINDKMIYSALEKIIKNQAMIDYETIKCDKDQKYTTVLYADHVAKPEILAYAIKNNIFSKRELSNIPFDHNDTIESFVKKYDEPDLLKELYNKLMNPKSIVTNTKHFDEHPSCCR